VTDEREIRRLEDRLRRRKRALERRNPLNDLDAYRERFREVIAMEARLRDLKSDGDG
jgi:hypothetical protein